MNKLDEIFKKHQQDEDIFGDVNKLKQEIFDYFESLVVSLRYNYSKEDGNELFKDGHHKCIDNLLTIIKKKRGE